MKMRWRNVLMIIFGILLVLGLGGCFVLSHPAFGELPSGARQKRIESSPNYRDGAFQNLEPTEIMTGDRSAFRQLASFLFARPKETTPQEPVEAIRTDLKSFDRSTDRLVWFGHSSYLLFIGGKTVLVDPVLTCEFPASWMMTPFAGSDLYTPADLPEIDILVLTHDHWDHLDYGTLRDIRTRVKQVVCPLGVGAHLEKWGYAESAITELDWNAQTVTDGFTFTCLPQRHFSGRHFIRFKSLWSSFMLEANGKTVFIGGDGGQGQHFAQIAARFPEIDLALLENGQYDASWAQIHTLPSELPEVIRTLRPKKVIPIHNGKYSISNHPWDEPQRLIREANEKDPTLAVEIPVIGKPITID